MKRQMAFILLWVFTVLAADAVAEGHKMAPMLVVWSGGMDASFDADSMTDNTNGNTYYWYAQTKENRVDFRAVGKLDTFTCYKTSSAPDYSFWTHMVNTIGNGSMIYLRGTNNGECSSLVVYKTSYHMRPLHL